MKTYLEALNIILSQAQSFGTEMIHLDDADGRVLSEDIAADRDYPPFNRSAMDGYAIMIQDWQQGIREFEIQEIIYAGASPSQELKPGAAFKIMTGAAVPFPANAVIRKEDCVQTGNQVSLTIENLKEFQNVARKGEDLLQGDIALPAQTSCSPAAISTLATLGKSEIQVTALPKVALFTTGNEVKPLGAEVSDTEIRNSNYYLLRSLLKKWKITPSVYRHLPDDVTELRDHIENALDTDIIIMSGGVSAGDADYVPEVLESLGVEKLFHKVSIKPGKPIWCGKAPGGPIVFALPGNPFSSFVTFKIFVESFLSKSMGLNPPRQLEGVFRGEKRKKTNFDEFFPVKFSESGKELETTSLNGSGDIRLGINANALAVHPAATDTLREGQIIPYYIL